MPGWICVCFSFWNTHAWLPGSLPPGPSPRKKPLHLCVLARFSSLGHLSYAVSAAYCKASIRCHNCWGDWVNGQGIFPREAATDRLAFVCSERSLNLKLCPRQCAGTPGVWLFGHRSFSAVSLTLLGGTGSWGSSCFHSEPKFDLSP